MADIADHANDLVLERMEAALAARALVVASESAHECECCGEPIPPRRREAVPGCQTCIECQSFNERRGAPVSNEALDEVLNQLRDHGIEPFTMRSPGWVFGK
ncbi:TPA: TraR/DksA C4-type zinc finger protein, partial [Pseudomonas aeruginosa]